MIRAANWQRFEGAILLLSGLAIYWQHHEVVPWWAAILLFFSPDISFAGYGLGPRVGAFIYNCVHVYAFGAAVLALGLYMIEPVLVALGALWLGHSGFDRMLGYGLKSAEGFAFTHLGQIGHPR